MKKITVLFHLLTFSVVLIAQDYGRIEQRANDFFKNEEYSMALRLYDSLLNYFPDNPFYLTRSGSSYLNSGETKKAISMYREALKADSSYKKAVFQLASAYDKTGLLDSAIHFFKRYIDLDPDDPNAYNRLAVTYMARPDFEDSALAVSKRSITIAPDNPSSYYINAMALLNNSLPVDAIFSARKGLEKDSTFALLYMPLGIAHLQREDYRKAYEFLNTGMNMTEDKGIFVEYTSFAKILLNTDKKQIKHSDNNRIYFTKIHSKDREKLMEEVRKENSEYYYPDLLAKFNDRPFEFSLDEFLMLYLGFTTDHNYSPYFPESDRLQELWGNEDYNKYLNEARIYLLEHPVSFHIYLKIAMIADIQGLDELHFKNMFRYNGFVRAVMATGNGETEKDALLVCYPWHEGTIISEMGYEIKEQSLIKNKGEIFELVSGIDASGNTEEFYFNITIPYKELEKALSQ